MRIRPGAVVRRALSLVAVAAGVLTFGAGAASAAPIKIAGPADLSSVGFATTDPSAVVLNETNALGAEYRVPANGKLTGWSGQFNCTDGCGLARLVVLRGLASPYTIVDESAYETPSAGLNSFPLADQITVQEGDRVAVEFDGGKLYYAPPGMPGLGASTSVSPTGTLGSSSLALGAGATEVNALYNVSFEPAPEPKPTTLEVDVNPTSVLAGSSVTLTAAVKHLGSTATDAAGTVAFKVDDVLVPTCTAVPVVNGVATCAGTAGSQTELNRQVRADFTPSDDEYEAAGSIAWFWVYGPATVTAAATPSTVLRGAPITYKANVDIIQYGSVTPAAPPSSFGTVAFFVDSQAVAGCDAQPVVDGVATCPQAAPLVKGDHVLKVAYSGMHGYGPNTATAPFKVVGPEVTVTGGGDFGAVTVGEAATRTVTVTNSGDSALNVESAKVDVPFQVVGTTCSGSLKPGASCTVELAFRPTAAGAHTGSLVLKHDAGSGTTAVALSGTAAVAATPEPPAPPAPPAPDTPAPPVTGGKLDAKGSNPSLQVTVPSSSKQTPGLTLPLACPANEECLLNGVLTINTSTLSRRARAASADTTTVARFSKVQVKAGGLKTVKLKVSRAFIREAQKKGIRSIRATLTINTVLGSGARATTTQQVRILIPKAAKKKQAVKKVKPRFTG